MSEVNTRKYFLTCWNKDIIQEDLKKLLDSILFNNLSRYIIGNTEKTENENEHYHVFLDFKNPIRFSTLKKRLQVSSIHIEKAKGTILDNYNYCTKEGLFYCNFNISDFEFSNDSDNDVFMLMINDIYFDNFDVTDCLLKYGKIAFLHIEKIKEVMNERDKRERHMSLESLWDDAWK